MGSLARVDSDTGGIYSIYCAETGLLYIGQAWIIHNRWRRHRELLFRGKHGNRRLQDDWDTYGEAVFTFTIEHAIIRPKRDALNAAEREIINKYLDAGYCLYNEDILTRIRLGTWIRKR